MSNPTLSSRSSAATAVAPEIQLRLSLDELNLVLEGVGNLPFARVFALVGKLQAQAGEQLQAQSAQPPGQGA